MGWVTTGQQPNKNSLLNRKILNIFNKDLLISIKIAIQSPKTSQIRCQWDNYIWTRDNDRTQVCTQTRNEI